MDLDANERSAQRDPEALLRQIEAAERAERRGQLKIFLGYASGVGKSFKLFDEGRFVYFLGIGSVLYGVDADIDRGREQRREGGVAHGDCELARVGPPLPESPDCPGCSEDDAHTAGEHQRPRGAPGARFDRLAGGAAGSRLPAARLRLGSARPSGSTT